MSQPRGIWPFFFALLFRDPARPVEWLSLAALLGWSWCLLWTPQVLERDSYTAFEALPASIWALLMLVVATMQMIAILPIGRRDALRFVAMTCACGLWVVVAINFIGASVPTTGVGMYCAMAVITMLTGVWLGWAQKHSFS